MRERRGGTGPGDAGGRWGWRSVRRAATVQARLVSVVLAAMAATCAAGVATTGASASSLGALAQTGVRTDAPAALTVQPAAAKSALAVLGTLRVKGRAPRTGYRRTVDFGAAWLDVDRNGCDTRDDILRRDLTGVQRTRCVVRSGTLIDPYTRHRIRFVRGVKTSTAVQIDHVVPLGDAWRTGAQQLSQAQRTDLANDPINLFAVDGPTNEQKSDQDAASWLPPNKAFRCTYAAHQVGVKKAYGLWVTAAERDALRRVLRACPELKAPVSTVSTVVPKGTSPRPGVSAGPTSSPRPSASPSASVSSSASASASARPTSSSTPTTDPRYATCTEAKAHHAHTPYFRGRDPEYAWYQDRDHDGIVCE